MRTAPNELVQVNKYLLINAAGRLLGLQQPRPTAEWVIFYLTVFVSMVFILATADFRDSLLTPKDTWHGFALFVLAGSAIGTGYCGWRYVNARRAYPKPMTAEEWYEQLVEQMEKEKLRIADLDAEAKKAAAQ